MGLEHIELQFIRCYSSESGMHRILTELAIEDMDAEPSLLTGCFSRANNLKITDKLKKEFMKGLC